MKIFYFILILSLALIGRSFSEITYLEILKNPTDLRLNLQYAKEQEKTAEYNSVIATLERLTNLYTKNVDLILYLLLISIKTDST
jgi:hypothetical protein